MSQENLSRLDLIFWSTGAGWSSARLTIDERVEQLALTHIFNNPHEEIAKATAELIEGRESAAFVWLDEPGTYAFDFLRPDRSPTLHGRFRAYDACFVQRVPENVEPRLTLSFSTHLDYWVSLVQASLARTRELSRHSLYSSWNQIEVPGRELSVIERYLHHQRSRRTGEDPLR